MSAHEEEVTGEEETNARESNGESNFPALFGERVKASLEPLHAQISALTEMMDRLMQSNSARETNAVSFRETRHQYELPYSGVPRSSSFPTVAPLNTSRYSPGTGYYLF